MCIGSATAMSTVLGIGCWIGGRWMKPEAAAGAFGPSAQPHKPLSDTRDSRVVPLAVSCAEVVLVVWLESVVGTEQPVRTLQPAPVRASQPAPRSGFADLQRERGCSAQTERG